MVLVTSCRPRQGATVAAACLAYALSSEAGSRTLLVDAGTRAPRLHALFDLPDGPGLAELLASTAEPGQAVHDTPFPNLSLVPRGADAGHPLNAARRGELVDRLQFLSGGYDYVVIDTDALSASSGVTLLAPHVAGVLLVVEAGRTRRAEVAEARAKIDKVGGAVLGVVLNKATA